MGVVLLIGAVGARAELTIEISQGSDNPTTIAVVPFAWQGAGAAPEDLAGVVDGDLARSGQFAPIARTDMLGKPSTEAEVFYQDWRSLNTEYVLIGRVSMAGQLRVDYELFDVLRQTKILSGYEAGAVSEARMVAHRVADAVYEKLTGVPGAFATRLLYISGTRVPGGKDYSRLTMSDSDGGYRLCVL
jgi:TolB protein